MNTTATEQSGMPEEMKHVTAAARDALTDEMVARLSATAAEAIELIDQVNRSGLAKAIPTLAEMVKSGDLERLVQLARVYGSAEDALTDEMVGRVMDAVGGGLSLLDQIHRSGLEKALPVLARLVADGDLERVAQLARVYSSAEDALTDEMIGRIAETIGEGFSLLDRLSRGGADHLVGVLEHMDSTGALERLAGTLPKFIERMDRIERLLACFEVADEETRKAAPPKGGLGGLWQLVRSVETQHTLQFLVSLGKHMRAAGR